MQNCFCVTKLAILTINAKEFLNFFRNPAEKKRQFPETEAADRRITAAD